MIRQLAVAPLLVALAFLSCAAFGVAFVSHRVLKFLISSHESLIKWCQS